MNLDAVARRGFPVIVCAALGAAARLQASGFAELVEETWIEATSPEPPARPAGTASPGDVEDHVRSAAAILARNPFDSVTGPLDGTDVRLPAAPPAPRSPRRSGVLREIADRVRKISEREIVVDRTAVDLVLAEESELLRSTRLLPVKESGKVVGYRVTRVRSGSLLDVLGMKTGDQLRSINGLDLTDPQQALEAFSRLRGSDELTLALRRDGADTSIAFHLR